jgi:uncharacterized membrane protein (UPF0127 family)
VTLSLFSPDGDLLARETRTASGLRDRTRGLIGSSSLDEGIAFVIEGLPAVQVHTFGMRYPIDVLFCDRDLRVLHVVEEMKPRRVTRLVLRARKVIELPAGRLRGRIARGDVLRSEELRPNP